MIDTEALRKKYSPEGSHLRELQFKLLDEVLFLDKVCKENGLTYFIAGGSALGAVRHQGFIPWDDDLDIALPEKDYKKLISILRKIDLPQYVLHDHRSDYNYICGFPKFREREGNFLGSFPERGKLYKYKGAGVDIFCMARNSHARAFVCAKLRVLLLHYMYKIKNDRLREIVTRFQWFVYRFLVMLTWPLNVFRKKGELHDGLGQGFSHQYMWEQEIYPVIMGQFESCQLPIPKDADAYLTHLYGDWRQIPSEEEIQRTIHNSDFKQIETEL